MKIYIRIFGLLVIFFLVYKCSLKEKINCGLRDTINHRHNLIDSLYHQIDSLYHVVDTLQYENELFTLNMVSEKEIVSALMHVESRNNDSAHNVSEDAVGSLQIRQTMVDDINRILKYQKSPLRFTYNSRWYRDSSIQMFEIYCNHYRLVTAEEIARCWNGGPRGIDNPATVGYWEKVKIEINS